MLEKWNGNATLRKKLNTFLPIRDELIGIYLKSIMMDIKLPWYQIALETLLKSYEFYFSKFNIPNSFEVIFFTTI